MRIRLVEKKNCSNVKCMVRKYTRKECDFRQKIAANEQKMTAFYFIGQKKSIFIGHMVDRIGY
jgi:hypothetical protein